ncbi:hypothetical protein EWM64_g2151 [Hericium alpestre]|uniref:ATP-dependent DNA helicase n=1 Tax=Hericium alpestre TaxID=135208 RepID=A0A4Z0A4A6_9AGAM|nr:hypothetical protein EWM64_g2151 [Hericium alpestre]
MAKTQDVFLSDEQRKVLRMVVEEEKSVFFTGSAGTGKSLLLRAIIEALRKKHAKKGDCISVTASTGMAATNIGGMTIHAWGAIAPTVTDIDNLIKCIRTAKPALQRWKNTRVLIIDEVSMVDGHLFERLATLATRLRKKTTKPFGGIQLVVTGDFFQLPPVTKGNEVPFFAFESEAWKTCIQHTVVLNKVFRQKDNKFVDLLNELRHGSLSESTTAAFRALSRPLDSSPTSLPPTELYPLRHEVDRSNISRLAAIKTRIFAYTARDSGSAPLERRKTVLAGMVVPEKVNLKVGAQVMLVRNVDDRRGLVNGAVGCILGFYHALGSKAADGVVRDVAIGNDGKPIFCGGELVQSAATPEKENLKPSSSGKPVSTGGKAAEKISDEKYPLVEFLTGDGKVTVLVTRDEFRVEDNEGNVLARRVQVRFLFESRARTAVHAHIDTSYPRMGDLYT